MSFSVLFVDDDPALLASLRRQMRELRKEYSLRFADSGRLALECLDAESVDLVISDMRMPQMDGAELLTRISEQSPETIRVILSGQAESQQLFTALGVAHLILAKPCKAETLKNIIKRCRAMKEVFDREDVRRFGVQRDQCASTVEAVHNLIRMFRQNDVVVQSVAEVISKDVIVAGRVLELVNSAYFGLANPVVDIQQAIALLGLSKIKAIYLNVSLCQAFESNSLASKLTVRCMDRGIRISKLACASLAERKANSEWQDDCLLASVLADIGMPIMASLAEEDYTEVLTLAGDDHEALVKYENEILGCTHAEVGAFQLSMWGFDPRITEAVLNHAHGVDADVYTIGNAVCDANRSLAESLEEVR